MKLMIVSLSGSEHVVDPHNRVQVAQLRHTQKTLGTFDPRAFDVFERMISAACAGQFRTDPTGMFSWVDPTLNSERAQEMIRSGKSYTPAEELPRWAKKYARFVA